MRRSESVFVLGGFHVKYFVHLLARYLGNCKTVTLEMKLILALLGKRL